MVQPTKGLGKGLSALMGDSAPMPVSPTTYAQTVAATDPESRLPISALKAGAYQPRRHFDPTQIEELASSIKKHGLMQPIVVRALAHMPGEYEIIAGERRFRAAKLAGLTSLPVIIRNVSDTEALELALIENIQRADLNPLEEAAGYQRLMDEFGYTQERLAPVVGKSRSHIANLLRLQKLPDSIKSRIDSGELTMGHARALLMAKDPDQLAKQIIEVGLSVRQAEDLAKGIEPKAAISLSEANLAPKQPAGNTNQAYGRSSAAAAEKSEDVIQLENMLSGSLGLKVSIDTRSGQAGEVVVTYESLTQLDEILRRLGGSI